MKKAVNSRILALLLAVLIMAGGLSMIVSAATYGASSVCLTPGTTTSSVNLTWYSAANTASLVQFALKSDMVGDVFPTINTSFNAAVSAASTGNYTNKAVVSGLTPSTQYVYRIGDGAGNWTANYFYTTPASGQFSFIACGDPQIGASGSEANDINGWTNTLTKALTQSPSSNYLLTTGDQVNTNTTESQFTGYFTPSGLKNLPVAPALGNHDNGALNYSYHFNLPNLSTYGVTSPGSADYYFLYENALVMVLNTNNTTQSTHSTFVSNAIAANPQAKWRIIVNHQSIYSSGPHVSDTDVVSLRTSLAAICDANKIDMVIAGHDHHYVRSYQMFGGQPQKNQTTDINGNVVNPTGTVYFTLNSGSGSKYYALNATAEAWVSSRHQYNVPEFSVIDVSDTTLSIKTYRTDTMALADSYGISKSGTPAPSVPGSFSLVSPSNGLTGVSRTPAFTWGASTNADSYTLVVSTSSSFTSPVINQSGITATSYTPPVTLNSRATYYWKVTAVNSNGSTQCNQVYSFKTKR